MSGIRPWLYFRFCLSYRDVIELLFTRSVTLTFGAIRPWCRQCGARWFTAEGQIPPR